MGKSRNKQGLLDTLIGEMLNYGAEDDQSVMDIIFSGDQKSISSIPLRYRIIGLGFVRKMSLEELNEKLESNGCEKLYGRSIYEASLMHAFNRGLSYAEWKELFSEVSKIRERIPADEHLSGSAVSLNDISEYVEDNSDFADNILKTQHVTQQVSGLLAAIPADRRALLDFIIKNLQSFSLSRECTRYYFCKYMMYYLATRRDYFINALKNDPVKTQKELASGMDALAVFRAQSKLTRKNYTIFVDYYAEKFIRSVKTYLKSSLVINRDLFFTFDTAEDTPDTRELESILVKFVKPSYTRPKMSWAADGRN